jgi:solute:Na+ symporter, SSS family
MDLAALDWLVIAASVLLALVVGLRAADRKRKHRDDASMDYILAGRSLTAPLFAATLIATWYGGVLGAGEFIARHGIAMILCFGLPYYVMAALYALYLSKRIRTADAVSIPDQIRHTYGDRAGYAAAALILVIAIPAPYMLTLGMVIDALTGWGLVVSVIVGALVAIGMVAKGGLRSDVHANVVQVVLMYAAFAALLVFCVLMFGSPLTMWDALPTSHREATGTLGWMGIAAWFVIAMQTFIDPNFHVRAAAARTPDVGQRGLFISIAGWIFFDGLQLMTGLYAVAYVPSVDPAQTFMTLANSVLPVMWKGLFIAGILAAVISTLDGYALVSSTMIGHDVIDRIRGGGHRKISLMIGLATTAVTGIVASLLFPSIVDLMFYAASIAVPALLLPLVRSYWPWTWHLRRRISPLIWMIAPAAVSIILIILQFTNVTDLQPMLGGAVVSALLAPFIKVDHERGK